MYTVSEPGIELVTYDEVRKAVSSLFGVSCQAGFAGLCLTKPRRVFVLRASCCKIIYKPRKLSTKVRCSMIEGSFEVVDGG